MRYSVDIAMMKVAGPPHELFSLGLGSCVAVALYDPVTRIGGLIHVLLPSISEFDSERHSKTKFADSGIAELLDAMVRVGAVRGRIRAKMAGGAAMFNFKGSLNSDAHAIGKRNIQSCRDTLNKLKIELVACDTGGAKGRSIVFYTETGAMSVRTIDRQEKII